MTTKLKSIKNIIEKNKAEAILIVLGSIFYMFMMLYRLTYSPLWFDEYIERIISQMSLKSNEMYSNIIITFQPPLYNFLMHFWLKVSTGILWFRLFNIIPGIITGLCLYLSIRKLYGYKASFLSIILLSLCYQYIYCVQECSEYQLMVMFAALTMYFYIKYSFSKSRLDAFLFILWAVCAMYSQYGAMFIVIPFLSVFYIKTLISKDFKKITYLTALYGIALFAAAVPLYVLYASKQLKENAIAEHTTVNFGISELLSLFTKPGHILGYLYNIPVNVFTEIVLGVVGVLFIVLSIYIALYKFHRLYASTNKNTTDSIVFDLIIILLIGYVLHYFLVVFHIYAMVHPGQSGGFFARYSYFYIPLVITVFVIICMEMKRLTLDEWINNKCNSIVTLCVITAIVTICFAPGIMKNWHKAYDDIFAETWVENHGWEQPTYLIGQAKYGFDFFIKDVYGDAAAANAFHESQLDTGYMPEAFWLWRTDWGGDNFDLFVNEAKSQGYNVEILYDYGLTGQLAHVTR